MILIIQRKKNGIMEVFNSEGEFVTFYNNLEPLEKIWYYKCGAFIIENNQLSGKISADNNWMSSVANSIQLFDFRKNFNSVPLVENKIISGVINNKVVLP